MRNELQADCLAGATLAKAEQDGYLTADPGR
jgi:predicted metalloprotease